MSISVKRVYEKPSRNDGARILVDRLWPRGLTKTSAALEAWLKNLAPSNELRKWFHARPEAWQAFRKKYLKELSLPAAAEDLGELYRLTNTRTRLTLVFASTNTERNNATVLKELLDGMRKPPTGTGPGAAGAVRQRKVRQMPGRR